MRWPWPTDRVLGWLLPTLAIVAEGAFLAVIYVAVETAVDHRVPLLGTFEMAAAAGIAAVAVNRRWLDPDVDFWRFLGLLAVVGLVGWMWDDRVRDLVLAGDPLAAIPLHPGGWLTVVAAMRGVGRAIEVDDRAVTRLVLAGIPALAIPWTIGQLGSGAQRALFTEEAFVASLTFVTAGFIAAGLARLREIGRETGVDWRHDRSWLGTVFGVIGVVLLIGVPASILLGLPGDAVARGILGPIVTVASYVFIAGFTAAALVAVVIASLLRSLGIQLPQPMSPEELARLPIQGVYEFEQLRETLTGLIALWIALVIVLIVLARVWLRRRVGRQGRVATDERSFRIPQRSSRARVATQRSAAAPRPGPPHDAVTAYLAALDDLAGRDPDAARAEHETPRSHARRVDAGPALTALQADYALAQYGGRSLTDAEHQRALRRWRRLRG